MEELINKYFEKTLTEKELVEFNKKLETDNEFKAEFEFQKSVQSAIRAKERAEIKNLVASFEKPKQYNGWWKYAAAAVVVIIGGWVVFQQFLGKSDTSKLYMSYYQTYPNVIAPNVRGESEETVKTRAFAAYEAGDFLTSAQLFGKLKEQVSEDYATFYEGISYLEINKPEKTIALFENEKFNSSKTQLENYRQWYLALAYLKTNQKEKAIGLFSKICNSANPQKEKAQEILDNI